MAHSLRRPLFASVGLSTPSTCLSRRCFSSHPPLRFPATDPSQRAVTNSGRPAGPSDRSMRVMAKGAQQLPSDLGLLESTFVPPTGKNRPPFSAPRSFLRLYWRRFLFGIRDRFGLSVLKWSSPAEDKGLRRVVKLNKSAVAPTAVALHRQMYSAFAEGDVRSLSRICADGIFTSFRGRISNRPKGETVVWELLGYNGRAAVVSNRAARLPIDGAAIRQAVVRIRSRQKLTRFRKGVVVEGSGKERDVTEYVVVQRMFENWKPGDWKVWGTTEETTLDHVDEWERKMLE